jgi:hypothetical protein
MFIESSANKHGAELSLSLKDGTQQKTLKILLLDLWHSRHYIFYVQFWNENS